MVKDVSSLIVGIKNPDLMFFSLLFIGDVCPSPLLGVCPPCENCTQETTTTPLPPSNDQPFLLYNTTTPPSSSENKTSLPGSESDQGPFENYQGPERVPVPIEPKVNEQAKSPLVPNLPKYYQPKHYKMISGSVTGNNQ